MAIQRIEGNLKMLGNSTISDKGAKYSVIEIGEHLIQNATITKNLDNYLQRALGNQNPVAIWQSESAIKGVVVDGKLYAEAPATGVAVWIFATLISGLFSLFVVGIPFLLKFWFSDYPAEKKWEEIVNAFPGAKVVL